jgi:glycosyltransferase involved in cell wall biosynthesis
MPDAVQLNVIQKQGLLALWLKKRYGIPYVIIEHWSGYLPENGQFLRMPAFKRRLYALIAEKAATLMTVSERHAQAMRACGMKNARWIKTRNVVDDFFFRKTPNTPNNQNTQNTPKTLLHISCFDERAKNIRGLLLAVKMLAVQRQDFQLVLIGTGVDYAEVRAFADSLHLPEGLLVWTGELPPREVAEWLRKADALVLSSRYETYGVVLAEAAAAGVPIVSTPVGIAEETADLIVPHEIAQNKSGRFAEFIESILWSTDRVAGKKQNTARFTAAAVGKKLKTIYDSCLHRDI